MHDYHPLFSPLPDDAMACWDRIEEFLSIWKSPLSERDGSTNDEIEACERRLETRLPRFLQHWYRKAGGRVDLWSSEPSDQLYRMLPLKELNFETLEVDESFQLEGPTYLNVGGGSGPMTEKTFLVIRRADENSAKLLTPPSYGIFKEDLHLDDPPVWALWSRPKVATASLSAFSAVSIFYDTLDISEVKKNDREEELGLPEDARLVESFPANFGLLETVAYEGQNWICIVSGTAYFRARDPESGQEILRRSTYPFEHSNGMPRIQLFRPA